MYKKIPIIVFISTVLTVLSMPIPLCTPAYAEESEPECWAVIIGVSDYKRIEDAPGCANDAEELFQLLSPTWGEEHIKLLLDSEATKAKIRAAVDWLASNEDTNDTVLFYFSAHGDKGYIAPYNAYYETTWISSGELSKWLRPLDSERVAIILDTCHAAAFNNKLSDSGRVVLASSGADELSYGVFIQGEPHGVFSYYLLEALSEFSIADANRDYELSAEELFQYAEPKTVSETTDFYIDGELQDIQHPVLSDQYSDELSLLMKFIFSTEPDLPSGFDILMLDGEEYSSVPLKLTWSPGSVHDLTILSPLDMGGGTGYVFTLWNDGDTSISRTISHGGVYTANYKTQYQLLIESDYGQPEGEGWYDVGSTATISVTSVEEPTARHIFSGWSGDYSGDIATASVIMDSPKAITANWRTEYQLLIESDYGQPEGEGWYDVGSTATISVTSVEEPTARHIFSGWSGDYSGDIATASVIMDSPKVISANWRTEYLLTIESAYGEPEGEGWYDVGSTATISVAPGEGLIIRHFFSGWSGDFSGDTATASLTMDSPMAVTANWRTDYTRLYMLIGLIVLIAAINGGLRIRRRRKAM